MVEKDDVDKMVKRFLEEDLIEKLDDACYSFTPKAKRITKTKTNIEWGFFVNDTIEPRQIHYWLPKFYSDIAVNVRRCWGYIKLDEITEEMLQKTYEYFNVSIDNNLYQITDEFEDI